ARASEPAPGQETVETLCVACHSIAIVAQQRLSRRVWDEVMVWMVEEQGMPELDEDELAAVLDYLAENYGPDVPR
ncbi:MAG: cytochrome c, partial [Alphaproteobacteria bacterium]|nr:cytochrome c [Alphaproteobacteria bacterium]